MQLVVKRADSFVKEVRFTQGPVYIGRQIENNLCLDHESVLQEHSVLCGADTTRWFIEDLSREKKTCVNSKPVKHIQLRDGDIIAIGDYTIEVQFGGTQAAASAPVAISAAEAAAQVASRPPKNIIRRFDQNDSPDIRMPARRYKQYNAATIAIQKSDTEQALVKTLLAVAVQQLNMFHTFIAVSKDPTAAPADPACQAGKRRTGQNIKLHEMVFQHFIREAMEKKEYVLIPILPENRVYERIRSALIAPILSPLGCHGVIYVDNAVDDPNYNLQDLDYLILLAVQTGTRLMNI